MTTSSLTVDQYIDNAPADRQEILKTVRQTILTALPQATEKISYQMPTYHYHENIVHFAYAKHHLGFYPAPEAIQHFAKELAGYKTSKGAVQFPFDQPIPYQLIQDITAWRLSKILSKHAKIYPKKNLSFIDRFFFGLWHTSLGSRFGVQCTDFQNLT